MPIEVYLTLPSKYISLLVSRYLLESIACFVSFPNPRNRGSGFQDL